MYVEPTLDLNEQASCLFASRFRQPLLSNDRPDWRLTVVRGEIHDPALDGGKAVLGDPAHDARVVHAEENYSALRVGKGHNFAGHVLGVGREHRAITETNLLELGASILARSELSEDLVPGVEQGALRGHSFAEAITIQLLVGRVAGRTAGPAHWIIYITAISSHSGGP